MDTVQLNEGAIVVDGKKVFSDGDPSPSGHPPTRITARFLNNQMLELINLLEKAGITPDASSNNQLYQSILKIGLYRDYDAVVGDGYYSSIPDALEAVSEGSRVLIVKSQTVSSPITISKDDITIEGRPGINITSKSIDGSLFIVNAERTTFKDLRLGVDNWADGRFIFNLTAKSNSSLASNCRLFNFNRRPFQDNAPGKNLIQAGLVNES